jgi:hypothetical protein
MIFEKRNLHFEEEDDFQSEKPMTLTPTTLVTRSGRYGRARRSKE